jgi:hypothetical protein
MKKSMVTTLIALIVLSTISPTMMFALSGESDSGTVSMIEVSIVDTGSVLDTVEIVSTDTGTLDDDEEDEENLDL